MIQIKKIGPWTQVGKLLAAAPHRMQAAFDKALLQEAHFLRSKIVEGIREQAPGGRAFAPLAPTTLAIRRFRGFRGTKALLVHGDLRNSITVVKDGDRVFIGVLRTARTRAGKSLVDIAALHEHGSRPIALRLTPRARAFLHAAFRHAGLDGPSSGQPSTGIAVLQVPARPFLAPVFEKYAQPDQISRRFLERVAAQLRGDFGHISAHGGRMSRGSPASAATAAGACQSSKHPGVAGVECRYAGAHSHPDDLDALAIDSPRNLHGRRTQRLSYS